jgi:hypothetical protein
MLRSVCRLKLFYFGGKGFADVEEAEMEVRKSWDNSQKTSTLRVSKHR